MVMYRYVWGILVIHVFPVATCERVYLPVITFLLTSGETNNVFELHNLTAPSFGQHSHYLLRHYVNNVVTYIIHGYGVEYRTLSLYPYWLLTNRFQINNVHTGYIIM